MYVAKKGAFKKLSELRIAEAKLLYQAGHYCGAFYLAGYAVECALKAKIAKDLRKHDIPDPKAIEQTKTHNLQELLIQANLHIKFGKTSKKNSQLAVNWDTIVGVDGWSEESRYNETIDKLEAEKLIDAIDNAKDGILVWIAKN
jgi:HEPN domain-containing protein